jgi:NAD(P)H-nitrite reductase large subunit
MSNKERIVIIGNGMAGGKLAEELVARGPEASTSRSSATSHRATTTGSNSW